MGQEESWIWQEIENKKLMSFFITEIQVTYNIDRSQVYNWCAYLQKQRDSDIAAGWDTKNFHVMYTCIHFNKIAWKWLILKKYNQNSTTLVLTVSYLSRFEFNGDKALCLTCHTDSGPWYRQKFIRQVHTIFLEHSSCSVKCDSPKDLDIFEGSRNKAKLMPMQSQGPLLLWLM